MFFKLFCEFNILAENTQYTIVHRFKVGISTIWAVSTIVESVNTGSQGTLLGLEIPWSSIHV